MGSRINTSSSTSSARSARSSASNASSTPTDSSLKALANPLSSSPETFQLSPPVTFQFPPSPTTGSHGTALPSAAPLRVPSNPTSAVSIASTPLPTMATASQQESLLARRTGLPPMRIVLPPNPALGLPSIASTAATAAFASMPSSRSAPLQPPITRGKHPSLPLQAVPSSSQSSRPFTLNGSFPDMSLAHDSAPRSTLTPSTFAKFIASSIPSYDFALATDGSSSSFASTNLPTPSGSLGLGDTSFDTLSFPYSLPPTSFASSCDAQPEHSSAQPPASLCRTDYSYTTAAGTFGAGDFSSTTFDPSAFAGSFHLPSPGLTFSTSSPYWYSNQGQYFGV
ncbi:hypothetical protein JCM1840_005084 [Sporobolomyces johnsonii]